MKKRFMALSALLALCLLAGCARSVPEAQPQRYFTAGFTLRRGEAVIEGTVAVLAYDDLRLTFTRPQILSYLTLRRTAEGFEADIAGAGDEIAHRTLPTAAPVNVLCDTLREVLYGHPEWSADGDGTLTARTFLGDAEVLTLLDAEGYPARIACEQKEIYIDFTIL